MAFSIDLRERVIAAVEAGMRPVEAAKLFKISRKVIYNWKNLLKKNNSLAPKVGYQNGHSHKIKDLVEFKKFAEAHQQCSAPQMVIQWEISTGIKVSESAMLKTLKKIDYTSKKKLSVMSKRIKQSAKNF